MIAWLVCFFRGHVPVPHYDSRHGHYFTCARCGAVWRSRTGVAA